MTDRYHSFTVVLERDTRDDDAQDLLTALRQFRGVADVVPNVASLESQVALSRARQELGDKLVNVLWPKP